tara:strand:- start:1426 stop:2073 length:648 start_codon:yes stop_codon:yes gene_type:complete
MKIKEKILELGNCIELVAIDPHFYDVSIGLFRKENILTVWSYSNRDNINDRLRVIRDRCCLLADLYPIKETYDQMTIKTMLDMDRPIKFMFSEAVEKISDITKNNEIQSKDTKTNLIFNISQEKINHETIYKVSTIGENERASMRIRAVVGGFIKYGGCERVEFNKFKFSDGQEYNKFVKLLLPYARNISAIENMISASDSAGQMNTQTLGFSQT